MSGGDIGKGTRINDTKPFCAFYSQVRVQNPPRSPTMRYRCGSNGMGNTMPG